VKDQIKTTLDVHEDLGATHKEALTRWKGYLTPQDSDLGSRLRDIVVKPGWHHRKKTDGTYTDVSREDAERFASEAAANGIDLVPFLPQLLSGEQQQTFSFGAVLGREHPRAKELICEILALWPSLEVEERNPSLASGMMRGLGGGSEIRTATLERIAAEPTLIDLLVPLTASLDAVSESDFLRIRNAVVESRLDSSRLRNLIPGLPLRMLPASFLIDEFTTIFKEKPESAQVLFEVLFSHCHGDAKRFDQFLDLFGVLLLAKDVSIGDTHFGWEWQQVALKLVSVTTDNVWLRMLADYICQTLVRNKTWVGTDYLSVVASKLFGKAPMEAWGIFANALATANDFEVYVLAEFLGKAGSRFDDTNSPLWSLPEDQFRTWVQAHRSMIPLILGKISLYTVEKQPEGQEVFKWHPHALVLLMEGTDEQELERALAGNLLSFGSTGSRVPYLEKRVALVRSLSGFGDARLARVSGTLEDWLNSELDRTRREELNENARFQ
jgi:hypothetical protein